MTTDLVLAATTGLLGGFGHCAGMCGPLVAGFSLASGPVQLGRPRPIAALAPHLLYNAGRLTTYAWLGAVMGLTGSFVNTAGRLAGLQDVVSVLAGALMVLLGLGAAGVLRPLASLERRLAGRLFGAVRAVVEGGGPGRFYPLGLVLGLLPCGLSYSAFMGAAATGSLPRGLLFALAFGVGTVPALVLVGGASALVSQARRGALRRAGGVAVALLGALFLARGLGLHAPL